MLTEEQYKMIEYSYKHGGGFVFRIEKRVFVSFGKITYHRNKTYTFEDCSEVDITCFEKDGTEYWGEICPSKKTIKITVKDPYDGGTAKGWWIASQYYKEDIVKAKGVNL